MASAWVSTVEGESPSALHIKNHSLLIYIADAATPTTAPSRGATKAAAVHIACTDTWVSQSQYLMMTVVLKRSWKIFRNIRLRGLLSISPSAYAISRAPQ